MENLEDEARQRWFRHEVLPLEARLLGYALRVASGNRQDAEDLVHDTLLRIMDAQQWRQIDNPASFALRTMHNLAIDTLRRRKVIPFDALSDLGSQRLVDGMPGPEQTASGRSELEHLAQVIAALPRQCRQVLLLKKVEGLSHKEIAERLGIAISTIEKHLAKGLRICTESVARRQCDTGQHQGPTQAWPSRPGQRAKR